MRVNEPARSGSRGFVSLDVFWIVLLLAGVVFLAVRGIDLVEKRDAAARLQRELVAIEAAVKKAATENELDDGAVLSFAEYEPFLNKGLPKRLREKGEDQLGGKFGDQTVGELAVPDQGTIETLGRFWER